MERDELVKELEAFKDRLSKLKTQEQAVVDEEEAIFGKLSKLSSAIKDSQDKEVLQLWRSVRSSRPCPSPPLLLSLSLGSARFFLPDKQRLRYKREYEKFKLMSIGVQFVISCLQLLFNPVFLDAISNFHLVYYYSVLTLREHILVANGSHIRFWWRAHHYLCVVIAGLLLIWPMDSGRHQMRTPLLHFAIYVSGVQVLQYRYQMRRLYTLRAMARVGPMETTTESATVHVKNDLAFMLPFLLIGHFWQFLLARKFYECATMPLASWHVGALCLLFLMIGLGNLSAVLYTAFLKYIY